MRLLIAIKSCQKDKRDGAHQAIRETWGKTLPEGVDLLFFVGGSEAPSNLEADERYLTVPDGYWELYSKTLAILRYAVQKSYDFCCLCDTDSYLILSELMRSGFEFYDYSGACINPPGAGVVFGRTYPAQGTDCGRVVSPLYAWFSGGHGCILSKDAAKIIATTPPQSIEGEDMWLGQTLGPFIMEGEIKAAALPGLINSMFHLNCGFHGSNKAVAVNNRLNVSNALWKKYKELTGHNQPSNSVLINDDNDVREKTALVVIASGEIYWRYAEALVASAKKYFIPHDVFLFTDRTTAFDVKKQIVVPFLGFSGATLGRYRLVLMEEEVLSQYENIFYCDADMLFVSPVFESDILSDGITVTQHPGYLDHPDRAEYESRLISTAYLQRARTYFCGGFNGGTSAAYLKMAKTIQAGVKADSKNGITALWYDESHLNRYCYDNPPAKVLSVAFCYPSPPQYRRLWIEARGVQYADSIIPKLRALEKTSEERVWRGGPQ